MVEDTFILETPRLSTLKPGRAHLQNQLSRILSVIGLFRVDGEERRDTSWTSHQFASGASELKLDVSVPPGQGPSLTESTWMRSGDDW